MKENKLGADSRYGVLRAAVLLLTAALCFWIRPAADDFYYVTFGDGGWEAFWENNWIHYRDMTGRVFVHLVLYPLLQWDMWPFRIFNVVLVGIFGALSARLCAEKRERRCAAMVFVLSIFWLAGIEALADGVLWGAGSLNYLFPVTLVVFYALMIGRVLDRGGSPLLGIPAFLCACTVEMTGILPLVVLSYLCLTRREEARRRRGILVFLGVCTLAGYLFLFSSQGVGRRVENNETGLGLLETILVNYAMIDRKACGPEGIWAIVVLALASCGGVLLRRGSRPGALAMALGAGAVTLTGLGVVYDGVAVAVIAILAFLLLAVFAIWSFRMGERQVPLWMLCTTVSLGVCLVAPVMGARLILPAGMFLTIVAVRNLMCMELPHRWELRTAAVLTAAACVLLCSYTVHYAENARIIDQNTQATKDHAEGSMLYLSHIPDEYYCKETVPSGSNFGLYYLKHYGLDGVSIRCQDPTAAAVQFDAEVLEQKAVLRDGQYYIPIRAAETVCGAEVRWELACAAVETEDGLFCFHKGNRVANLGHGICPSVKLADPVRTIDGKVHISIRDFEMLFGVELTVLTDEA